MSLIAKIKNGQLELEDQTLTLQMNLHEGLILAAALDENQDAPEAPTQKLINTFYLSLLESLMLLGVRERQSLLNEASLEVLACLLGRFRGKPIAKVLRGNLSTRRLSQIEEETHYLQAKLSAKEELTQVLAPFFSHLDKQVKEGRIKLQDPKGLYF